MAVLAPQTKPGIGATDSQIAKILPIAWQHTAHIDPATIRPMAGRVLIRDEHDDSRIGSIVIPETSEHKDRNRIGRIVAVGNGEKWYAMDQRGPWGVIRYRSFDGAERREMQTKPGDRCVYVRRREGEIEIGGERLTLAYEEQACLAILED